MVDEVECVVVGAGVVGLAIARAEALAGREVVILEAEGQFGTATSARNSEVIHAGIYYPPGSLKARLCVAGRRLLYTYCESRGIAHKRITKLLVACSGDELPKLAAYAETAARNGLTGPDEALRPLTGAEARALEPALACEAAMLSPSTGIIDSHGLMLSYLGEAEGAGAMIAYRAPVDAVARDGAGFRLTVGGEAATEISCRRLINAAGLGAPALARLIGGVEVPRQYYVRGCYFTLAGRSPFGRLIYPMPSHAGLGVHITVDLGGQAKFGPDTEYIEAIDYTVDPARADGFYAEIRRYWPDLPDGALAPGYAGIRPKLQGPADPVRDFVIAGPETHGVPGLVNLFGIESPGLTASLAIAEMVASL
ncbi:MAG: NAD(P)/FAD-dependent oxidoreductase [Alphaproteobacteria bacterium]|jgi:L-2-hydroxyglutarate oxidase LhgO|nr:NAD(P)/FAD-dependent oxidoreductase [Alphaproteobacteria bacterium]